MALLSLYPKIKSKNLLCKEMGILKPQRVCRPKHPKRLPQRTEITGPDQLWEMDIKYGYIMEKKDSFYLAP